MKERGGSDSKNIHTDMLMNFWKCTITVISSASSSNGSSTYQKVVINLQCTPSNVPLSQQDLYPQLTTSGPHVHSLRL